MAGRPVIGDGRPLSPAAEPGSAAHRFGLGLGAGRGRWRRALFPDAVPPVFGHLRFALDDAEPVFEITLAEMARDLSLPYPPP